MRVDFSGRGVVAPDPALRMDQCGLPERMAFELYGLHLAGELSRAGYARTPAAARGLIDARPRFVRAALEALMAEHPVILGVERCLSRHGVQAFFPVLGRDEAIKLSPLAIERLMGEHGSLRVRVFLPLGDRAQQEACQRLTSPATLVAPETRRPRIDLSADARAGLYLASLARVGARGRAPLPAPRASWGALQPGAALSRADPLLRRLGAAHLAAYGALRGFFASLAEVERAIDAGEVSLQAHVFVRRHERTLATVAGRCLVMALLPPEVPCALANVALDRRAIDALLAASVAALDPARAAALAEALEALGLRLVTARGLSLCVDDLAVPAEKEAILGETRRDLARVAEHWDEGMITLGERYNKTIDLWAYATDQVRHAMDEGVRLTRVVDPETGEPCLDPSSNPLSLLADAGAAGGKREMRDLAAMKGLMARPSGEIFEVPIVASLREGLPPHAMLMDTLRDRAARVRRQRRDREDDRLAEILARALGRVRIVARDCGALGSLPMRGRTEGGEPLVSLADRVRGRVHAETGEVLAGAGEDASEIPVRSPIFCEAEGGLCAACYGEYPGAAFPEIGERVGLHAAHALSSQLERVGTLLFHIGTSSYPPASRASYCEAAADGILVLRREHEDDLATRGGERVVMRGGLELSILDRDGLEVPSGSLPYGAISKREPGARVSRGDLLGEWDQFARPLLAHHDGAARWVDLVDGLTVRTAVDEVTGLSRTVVLDPDGSPLRPELRIIADDGAVQQSSPLEAGAHLVVADGARVSRADVLARQPFPYGPRYDTMEGRPNLIHLLHARTDDPAVLNEIRGVVRMDRDDGPSAIVVRPTRGSPEIIAAGTRVYPVPRRWSERVHENDLVAPGAVLIDGNIDPRDIARVLGPAAAAMYIVDQLQLVYAMFGVVIDARHAEIVARALLGWARVIAQGEGPWEVGAVVPRALFDRRCRALVEAGLTPPRGEVTMQGLARRLRDGPLACRTG
jgi:DNA-directed RNA polymerase subunit beta'